MGMWRPGVEAILVKAAEALGAIGGQLAPRS